MSVPAPSSRVRPPAVAGTFYAADPAQCAAEVDGHLAAARATTVPAPKVIIAPHAGHRFSGPIAGTIYAGLAARAKTVKRVVLLGPAHRVAFKGLSTTSVDAWATPLGNVPMDWDGLRHALALPGVAVRDAAFAEEHSMEVHLPFLQRCLGHFTLVPLLVGDADKATVSKVIDSLWGGPETVIVISSDLSHFHDYETARALDGETSQLIELGAADKLDGKRACGHRAIAGALDQALRRDLRITAIDVRNSGDTFGDKSRVVGYGAYALEYAATARLNAAARNSLLQAARLSLEFAAAHGRPIKPQYGDDVAPGLMAMRASFITVELDGKLRGCIGSVIPHNRLLPDVVTNAYKAGFGDPRFQPMTAEEVARADISVSILSHTRAMRFTDEADLVRQVRPDEDGLILRDGKHQGLFLPSVWRGLPKAADFVRHLKAKAGLPMDHWSNTLRVFRYTTESFGAPVAELAKAA